MVLLVTGVAAAAAGLVVVGFAPTLDGAAFTAVAAAGFDDGAVVAVGAGVAVAALGRAMPSSAHRLLNNCWTCCSLPVSLIASGMILGRFVGDTFQAISVMTHRLRLNLGHKIRAVR